jgi:hypothetical protein
MPAPRVDGFGVYTFWDIWIPTQDWYDAQNEFIDIWCNGMDEVLKDVEEYQLNKNNFDEVVLRRCGPYTEPDTGDPRRPLILPWISRSKIRRY